MVLFPVARLNRPSLKSGVLLVYGYLAGVEQEFAEVLVVFSILKNDPADGNFCASWQPDQLQSAGGWLAR